MSLGGFNMHVGKIVKHHKRLKKIEIEMKCLIHNNFKILNTKKKSNYLLENYSAV